MIESKLMEVILAIKQYQPGEHGYSPGYYLNMLKKDFDNIPEEIIEQGLDIYIKDELYKVKPIRYFQGIVRNLFQEYKRDLDKEGGGLPSNIMV
jgi:hypothetical protein